MAWSRDSLVGGGMGTLSWRGLWASGWGVRERLDETMAEFTALMSCTVHY